MSGWRCGCVQVHPRARLVVVTGGPGAGKTAVLELLRHRVCEHVVILPEAAGIVFGGGFPRHATLAGRKASQRAIFRAASRGGSSRMRNAPLAATVRAPSCAPSATRGRELLADSLSLRRRPRMCPA